MPNTRKARWGDKTPMYMQHLPLSSVCFLTPGSST
jgi:hypothetical protein